MPSYPGMSVAGAPVAQRPASPANLAGLQTDLRKDAGQVANAGFAQHWDQQTQGLEQQPNESQQDYDKRIEGFAGQYGVQRGRVGMRLVGPPGTVTQDDFHTMTNPEMIQAAKQAAQAKYYPQLQAGIPDMPSPLGASPVGPTPSGAPLSPQTLGVSGAGVTPDIVTRYQQAMSGMRPDQVMTVAQGTGLQPYQVADYQASRPVEGAGSSLPLQRQTVGPNGTTSVYAAPHPGKEPPPDDPDKRAREEADAALARQRAASLAAATQPAAPGTPEAVKEGIAQQNANTRAGEAANKGKLTAADTLKAFTDIMKSGTLDEATQKQLQGIIDKLNGAGGGTPATAPATQPATQPNAQPQKETATQPTAAARAQEGKSEAVANSSSGVRPAPGQGDNPREPQEGQVAQKMNGGWSVYNEGKWKDLPEVGQQFNGFVVVRTGTAKGQRYFQLENGKTVNAYGQVIE